MTLYDLSMVLQDNFDVVIYGNDGDMSVEQMWDRLLDMGVSEQTLQIVTDINGYNEEAMLDILYAHTGYRNFEQI